MHPYSLYNPYNSIISYQVRCICGIDEHKTTLKSIIQCTECGIWHHKECLKNMAKMPNFLCPKCQIAKGCLFYNILYTLLEPSLFELEPRKKNHGSYAFIPDLKLYPKYGKTNSSNPVFILIRCLKFDKNGFSYHWPKLSKIYLNEKLILDFTLRGTKKQDRMICLVSEDVLLSYDIGMDDWSRDTGSELNENYENFRSQNLIYDANIVVIDDYIYDKRPNRLEVIVNYIIEENLESTNFAVSIDCCEIIRDPKEIIQKIPIYREKRRLKELLKKNEDENTVNNNDTLSTLLEKINLMDLYTETERITLPARGINCWHLNVFDLRTFLLLNRKTNKYQCPYCKRYSINLYIDGVILDFLKNKNNYDVEEILMDKEHNIISYIHKKTNLLVNNEKKGTLYNNNSNKNNLNININNKNKKELFDINKKFEIHLNNSLIEYENNNINYNNLNRSFFSGNKDVNIISNFGQIFDLMKKEKNKDETKNKNMLYLGQKENLKNFDIQQYYRDCYFLAKYPKKNLLNDNKEDNYCDSPCEKIYDLMGNKKGFGEFIKNKEWIIPLDEKEENNKNKNAEKKDFASIHNNISNELINEGLFKKLFC